QQHQFPPPEPSARYPVRSRDLPWDAGQRARRARLRTSLRKYLQAAGNLVSSLSGERMIVCTRQITPELLVIDHFFSEGEDRRGACQTELFCGFQIDYQIEL